MPKVFRVDKEKCIGCGICVAMCDGAAELEADGKAKILDSEKMEKCGGESVCPYGAIQEAK